MGDEQTEEWGQERMEAGGKGRAEEAGAWFCLFSKLDLSLFLRTHEEAEFENEGKKRKPEGVKSLY